MQVLAPYTHVHPEMRAKLTIAAERAKLSFRAVDTSHSDSAYWDLLADSWTTGETFCVIEHDVLVQPDTLVKLGSCREEWCAFEVSIYGGILWPGLGAAKFSQTLIAQFPKLLDAVSELSDSNHPPKHWCRLDAYIQNHLHEKGVKQCVHKPPLAHLRRPGEPIGPTHAPCRQSGIQ